MTFRRHWVTWGGGGEQDRIAAINRDNGEVFFCVGGEGVGRRQGGLVDSDSDSGSKPDQLASMYVEMYDGGGGDGRRESESKARRGKQDPHSLPSLALEMLIIQGMENYMLVES